VAADSAVHAPNDLVAELEELVDEGHHLKDRKLWRRRLDKRLQDGSLSPERYQQGVELLGRLRPPGWRRAIERIGEVTAEHTLGVGFGLVVPIAGVDAAIGRTFIQGAHFLPLFLYALPLTLAVFLILASLGSGMGFYGMVVFSGAILVSAAYIQNHFVGGRHLHVASSTSTNCHFVDGRFSCDSPGWGLPFVAIQNIAVAYWHAFGRGIFIACLVTGVLLALVVQWRRYRSDAAPAQLSNTSGFDSAGAP
jgi:hypothetical protein